MNFIEDIGPRLYWRYHDIYAGFEREEQIETIKIRNEHRMIGLFFCASWSDPCLVWGGIMKSLQKELNDTSIDDKLLKCIIIPMTTKKEDEAEMKKLCYELEMPMIPFDEAPMMQHFIHKFNPDSVVPLLILVSNSGRVISSDGIKDIDEQTEDELESIKEKWLAALSVEQYEARTPNGKEDRRRDRE